MPAKTADRPLPDRRRHRSSPRPPGRRGGGTRAARRRRLARRGSGRDKRNAGEVARASSRYQPVILLVLCHGWMVRILFPLPNRGFDPTETSVPWKALINAGHEVVFATPDGRPSAADPRILSGRGFGPFRPWLRARPHARELYAQMEASEAFRDPLPYAALEGDDFDGMVDRKSTRLNSSHVKISYAVFC